MQENNGRNMILATIIVIVSVISFIIGYVCLVWPMAYVTDALIDAYPTDPNMTAIVGTVDEIRGPMISLNYFLAAAFIVGIALTFVWYWVYAHKRENEQY